MTKSAYFATADRVYSYKTCIRQALPGGLTIGNVTHYSATTALHQKRAECDTCDVLLGNVPRGTSDLLQLVIDRRLIPVGMLFYPPGTATLFHIESKLTPS